MELNGPVFMIYFEDQSRGPEVFSGEGAEAGARRRFTFVLQNWNAHLFQRIDDGKRPNVAGLDSFVMTADASIDDA